MAVFSRSHAETMEHERRFCRALLNHENPIWENNDETTKRKRGFRLPPDDFTYGLKHPEQGPMTGVAAALQHDCSFSAAPKSHSMPNYLTMNKITARLGLSKVHDIHQYRRSVLTRRAPSDHRCSRGCADEKRLTSNITYGRVTDKTQSIREIIENKYLRDWLEKSAIRRCREILNSKCGVKPTAASMTRRKDEANASKRNSEWE